jgi:hypothetical protein
MRKPTAGAIIKPPIDVIIINENIIALAVERLLMRPRKTANNDLRFCLSPFVAIFSYTTIADKGILVYKHTK